MHKGFIVAAVAAVAVGAVAYGSKDACANGDQFFVANDGSPPKLFYFGLVRDDRGCRLDNVVINIAVVKSGLAFTFEEAFAGYYRTADIGAEVEAVGDEIDPKQIRFDCGKNGYRRVQPRTNAVPATPRGGVEINCILAKEKVPGAAQTASE